MEIQKFEVYALLEAKNLPFEYERGAITFWFKGMKGTIYPIRWIPLIFSQIPVYHKEMLEILISD